MSACMLLLKCGSRRVFASSPHFQLSPITSFFPDLLLAHWIASRLIYKHASHRDGCRCMISYHFAHVATTTAQVGLPKAWPAIWVDNQAWPTAAPARPTPKLLHISSSRSAFLR